MVEVTMNPLWDDMILAVKQNVKPAMGCTEPVSLALAKARLRLLTWRGVSAILRLRYRQTLMKNGMGVTVPGTGMVGLPIAAALGALGGDAQAGLEVLKGASVEDITAAKVLLASGKVSVTMEDPCDDVLYASATVHTLDESATVTIAGGHTRVIRIVKNGVTLLDASNCEQRRSKATSLERVTLEQVVEFAEQVPFEKIGFILDAALLNSALSHEGLRAPYGLHIGATLQRQRERGLLAKDLLSDIIIRTSAASDARMGGACLPCHEQLGLGESGHCRHHAGGGGGGTSGLFGGENGPRVDSLAPDGYLYSSPTADVVGALRGHHGLDGSGGRYLLAYRWRLSQHLNGHQQHDWRCERHYLRWRVQQLRDESLDQRVVGVESGADGTG